MIGADISEADEIFGNKNTCAKVAKEFSDNFIRMYPTLFKSTYLNELAEKFKACIDFPKDPIKFETIWDCRPSLPKKLKMPEEIGKKWKVTFEEICE